MYAMSPLSSELLAFLILALVILSVVAFLILLRRHRESNQSKILPLHLNDKNTQKRWTHRRRPALIIALPASENKPKFDFVQQAKLDLINNSSSPPSSPIPEIRITFPEEVSEDGKRQSGRVVVVHVGENGIGLEPVEESLPAYQEVQKNN